MPPFPCIHCTSHLKHPLPGTSLMIQWLRLHTPNAGDPGSSPGQGTRSHMLQRRRSTAKEINTYLKGKLKHPFSLLCLASSRPESQPFKFLPSLLSSVYMHYVPRVGSWPLSPVRRGGDVRPSGLSAGLEAEENVPPTVPGTFEGTHWLAEAICIALLLY